MNLFVSSVLFLILQYSSAELLYEGSSCKISKEDDGVCTFLFDCPQALKQLRTIYYHTHPRCGFDEFAEIVCCPKPKKITRRKSIEVCEDYKKKFKDLPIPNAPFVSGGEDTSLDEYPHIVALGFYNPTSASYQFNCGGTLISNKYVITAAHCIVNAERLSLVYVRMGTNRVPPKDTKIWPDNDYKIKRVILHPCFKRRTIINDIALVELEDEAPFDHRIQPACLHTENEEPNQLQIAGWGLVSTNGYKSTVLQKATVSLFPLQQCSQYYSKFNLKLIDSQICTKDEIKDTCSGDSGGPLQILDDQLFTIVGITSYGYGCGYGAPSVYTKISNYLDWIEKIVWFGESPTVNCSRL